MKKGKLDLFGAKPARGKAPLYKTLVFSLVAVYILLYAISYFKSDDNSKNLSKMNTPYDVGDHQIYLVEKKYNPQKELLISKYYITPKENSTTYIPLSERNFEVETILETDPTKKNKSKIVMPNKNYLVVATKGYKENTGMIKLNIILKSDVVSVDEEKARPSKASFYFDTKESVDDDNLKIEDVVVYEREGLKYQKNYLEKEVEQKEKEIKDLDQENQNAYGQIEIVNDEMKELVGDDKENAELKIEDYRNTVATNMTEINQKKAEIKSLKTEIERVNQKKEKLKS